MWLGHLRLPSSWKAYAFLSAWVTAVVKLDWDQGVLKKKKKESRLSQSSCITEHRGGYNCNRDRSPTIPGTPANLRASSRKSGRTGFYLEGESTNIAEITKTKCSSSTHTLHVRKTREVEPAAWRTEKTSLLCLPHSVSPSYSDSWSWWYATALLQHPEALLFPLGARKNLMIVQPDWRTPSDEPRATNRSVIRQTPYQSAQSERMRTARRRRNSKVRLTLWENFQSTPANCFRTRNMQLPVEWVKQVRAEMFCCWISITVYSKG